MYMIRAMELAERGRGWTSPNPAVGAVIVKDAMTADGKIATRTGASKWITGVEAGFK